MHQPQSNEEKADRCQRLKQRRIWRACGRCRSLKIKCTNESPCHKCKSIGVICVPGSRKKKHGPTRGGYPEMLEYDHIILVATVRRLYEMLRDLDGWDLDAPETDDNGIPSPQSIAERLGFLSQSKINDKSDEKEDYAYQDPKDHSTSSDTCSADDEERLELNSNPPALLLHTVSPSLTGHDSNESITRCELLSPEPLTWQPHQKFVRSDQQRCDVHSNSTPDEIPLTPGLPNLSFSPFQEDVYSLPSGDYFHDELLLDSNFKFSTPTINPAMLQNSFSGLNACTSENGFRFANS